VIHPYISAILRLREKHGIRPDQVESVECPVAPFIVGIVCEPISEKFAPASDSHGRVSLAYSLAEALYTGSLGRNAYSAESRSNPQILALARKVRHWADPSYPGPGRFKGEVKITLTGGRVFEEVEKYNRGSRENPMSYAELRSKFDDNAAALTGSARDRLAQVVGELEALEDSRMLLDVGQVPVR
jgi:2-methylcitrate dehydratase PrpD